MSVAKYIQTVTSEAAHGVAETTHYPAIKELLNSAGDELTPKVRALIHPKGTGVGIPDGELWTAQMMPSETQQALDMFGPKEKIPDRGGLEVKGLDADLDKLKDTPQVAKYLGRYRQMLLTNLHEFAVVQMRDGAPTIIERYALADSPKAFLLMSEGDAKPHERPLKEFLRRALRAQTAIDTPGELAFFLASHARDAKAKLDLLDDFLELQALKEILEGALGIQFDERKGDEFFRAQLVETMFYGLFSAWVLWHQERPTRTDAFAYTQTAEYLSIPVIDGLYNAAGSRRILDRTGMRHALRNAADVLNRVERANFFRAFEDGEAVQFFYEPFLAHFDADLRKQMGVWYTPTEIVQGMVAKCDRLLMERLEEPDGLAGENVLVLDPCCGTGAFLVESLRVAAERWKDRGEPYQDKLRRAATSRMFGFELLTGPFVVAHLQVAFLLAKHGVRLEGDERAAVYLTNALTGWEPASAEKKVLDTLALYAESDRAHEVKREESILVVIGNPPYSGYAGISLMKEERSLSDRYRPEKSRGQGLNDLYVRFFAMADRRIQKTGRGLVCLISNYSWLEGLSFSKMRESLLRNYDTIWIDNLHGDKYATGKLTPTGDPDPSAFSTATNREGIQVGTAVATLLRSGPNSSSGGKESGGVRPWLKDSGDGSPWSRGQGLSSNGSLLARAQGGSNSGWKTVGEGVEQSGPDSLPQALQEETASGATGIGGGIVPPSPVPAQGGYEGARILYRDFWGIHKRANFKANVGEYVRLEPQPALGYPLRPRAVEETYLSWPRLPELLPTSFPGVKTSRDDLLVDIDRERLERRMRDYFDPRVPDRQIDETTPGTMVKSNRYDAVEVRRQLQKRGIDQEGFRRYAYRPFDVRWLYWEGETKLLDEKRTDYARQVWPGNQAMVSQQVARRKWSKPQSISSVGCLDLMDRGASVLPLMTTPTVANLTGQKSLLEVEAPEAAGPTFNLSELAWKTLRAHGLENQLETIFFHALAIMHAPAYARENAGALRQDWPRIPLAPRSADFSPHQDPGLQSGKSDPNSPDFDVRKVRIAAESNEAPKLQKLADGRWDASDDETYWYFLRQIRLAVQTEPAVEEGTDAMRETLVERFGTEYELLVDRFMASGERWRKTFSDPFFVRDEYEHRLNRKRREALAADPTRAWLLQGAELGKRIAALLDIETPVPGIETGDLDPALRTVARYEMQSGSQPSERTEDVALRMRWGYRGQGGVVMPGPDSSILLGDGTRDVPANPKARWTGVPDAVWNYHLGGYQVLKKWLSYREEAILGRPLTLDEVRTFTAICRRIAALLALGPELDAHYHAATAK